MTSNFGRRGSRRYHYGIDIKAQTGDTIYAAFDGKIRVKRFERSGYGYYLVIRHVNGLETVTDTFQSSWLKRMILLSLVSL
jgi:murein DD-endopeptidase MepM/ murein hydrolase activator NlpD